MDAWRTALASGLEDLALTLSEDQLAKISIYLEELSAWNKVMNLTGFETQEEMAVSLVCDSLACLKLKCLEKLDGKMVDVGTGAGVPGIPLAIVRPSRKWNLVDATQKKCDFLKKTVEKIQVPLAVHWTRAETFGRESGHRASYDVVFSRALAKISVNAELAFPLLKLGGFFVTYKNEPADEEATLAENALKILGGKFQEKFSYAFRAESGKRKCVLAFQKTGPTPKEYPRRPGLPAKSPL